LASVLLVVVLRTACALLLRVLLLVLVVLRAAPALLLRVLLLVVLLLRAACTLLRRLLLLVALTWFRILLQQLRPAIIKNSRHQLPEFLLVVQVLL